MGKRNVKQWYRHGGWWRRLWMNRRYKDAEELEKEIAVIESIVSTQTSIL